MKEDLCFFQIHLIGPTLLHCLLSLKHAMKLEKLSNASAYSLALESLSNLIEYFKKGNVKMWDLSDGFGRSNI